MAKEPTEQDVKSVKNAMAIICQAFDEKGWRYTVEEDNYKVKLKFDGEDFPIELIFRCFDTRNLIQILSFLPFKMSEDKRTEGAIATSHANYQLADGCFDYKMADGTILFRMCATYRDSIISAELIHYLVECTYFTVEKYNEQFFMISKGMTSIEDFIAEN